MLGKLTSRLLYPLLEAAQGRRIRAKLRVLREERKLSADERAARARRRLGAVLEAAAGNVPYYRELFARIGFDPRGAAADPSCVSGLPVLDKEILLEQGGRMLDERLDPRKTIVRKTNGSTGPALPVRYSSRALDWTAAANLFVLGWTGHRLGMPEAHLSSRPPAAPPARDRVREFLKCRAMNRTNLITDCFDPDGLEPVWRALSGARPHLVQGHPSTMYALACLLRDTGRSGRGAFQVFESTGEALFPDQRRAISDVFDCRVFDRYGNAEFGVVAHEVQPGDEHGLRVVDQVVWPEALEVEGRSELVLTGLLNDAMPLVRYRTGDLGRLQRIGGDVYLRDLEGRVHDVVTVAGRKYPTHYFQDLMGRVDAVLDFQIEERSDASPLLRLVIRGSAEREAVAGEVKRALGGIAEFEFVGFGDLKRSGSGQKFRHLVRATGG